VNGAQEVEYLVPPEAGDRTDPAGVAPTPSISVASPRLQLARLARFAALGTSGVLDADSGPGGHFVTVSHDERVGGVTCIAVGDSGYEVSLRLVCALVPLSAVARAVCARVTAAAVRSGLPLARVNVDVVEIRDPRFDADFATTALDSGRTG
jgi:hypothetical protein